MNLKTPFSSAVARSLASAPVLSFPAALAERLSTIYGLAQQSLHVFGSPLGPFSAEGRAHFLPRFVYFGPQTSEESPRIAIVGGFNRRDLRVTLALLDLVEQLAVEPDLGQSLHLAIFPLVDVLGDSARTGERNLASLSWAVPASPEIALMARDTRLSGYHAFFRVEMGPPDDAVTVRLTQGVLEVADAPLFSSEDVEPFPVRWERVTSKTETVGPSSLAEDLPFRPIDVTLRVPSDWTVEFASRAITSIVKRFALRYRGFLAYGQNL